MENELLYRILLLALLVSFVLHRGLQTRRSTPDKTRVIKTLHLGTNQTVINGLSLIAFLSSLVYLIAPSWIGFAGLALPVWLRWLGVAVALAGFGLMQWAQNSLGKNWSDTPVQLKEHSLTRSGPYRWVRHPIYTAFLLILSAPLFVSANWLIGLSWMLMTYIDVSARIKAEEAMLQKEFGQSFASYKEKTGRLMPKILRT